MKTYIGLKSMNVVPATETSSWMSTDQVVHMYRVGPGVKGKVEKQDTKRWCQGQIGLVG